jgi:uncharacterized membrane protein
MDLVIPYWHPIVVHFPVALLPFGAVAAAVYAVTGRSLWRTVALLAFVAGALGAWASVATGETIYEEVEGTPVVETFVEQHETYGEWALWTSVATVLLLVGAAGWNWRAERGAGARDPLTLRLVVLVFALAAAVLVALAGHLGGLMVWGVPP